MRGCRFAPRRPPAGASRAGRVTEASRSDRAAGVADSRLGHTAGVVLCDITRGVHAHRLGNSTLAERAAALLAEICEHVVVVEHAGDETEAIAAAVDAVETEYVVVLSADRPRLRPDLVIGLTGLPDADAAIPRDDLGRHTTCARYRCSAVGPALRAALAEGLTDVDRALRGLDVVWLEGASLEALDPTGAQLTPFEDVAALSILREDDDAGSTGAWPGHPGLGLTRPGSKRARD